jgi:hypothetical protein
MSAALDIENLFSYHKPQGNQQERYTKIRAAAKAFAEVVAECAPQSPEQTLAIRSIQMASMQANAAIACNESGEACTR